MSKIAAAGIMSAFSAVWFGLDEETLERYDLFNQYVTFNSEWTHAIDELLMNPLHGMVGNTIMLFPAGVYIPGVGRHYLYAKAIKKAPRLKRQWWRLSLNDFLDCFDMEYIVLDKRKKVISGREVFWYRAIIRPWSPFSISRNMEQKLGRIQGETVQTIHLDVSSMIEPNLVITQRIMKRPWPSQVQVVRGIIERYSASPYKNVKFWISGPKGQGKSYCALVLKKQLEEQRRVNAIVFDDFNPGIVGIDVRTHILSRASERTPVIVLIDEMDIFLEEAVKHKEASHDPRLPYTANKSTFNAFLDIIGETRHVIALYTSERSLSDFSHHEKFSSFVRRGRIDYEIQMQPQQEVSWHEIE